MSCPVYKQLRNVFLSNIDIENTTTDSFYSLVDGSEQEVVRLAKYIYNAFIIRGKIGSKKFLELLHDTYLFTKKLSCRVISVYIFW